MVDRVATYSHSQSLAKELMRLQSEYATSTLQASSGLVSDTYEGIGSETQRVLNIESEYSTITAQSENSQVALNKVNMMYSSVSSMLDLITSARSSISAALGGTEVDGSYVSVDLEEGMEEFASRLNTQLNGSYLFSGGASVAPVDVSDSDYALSVDGITVDDEYYQGSDYIAQVQASSGLTVEYGLTADSSGFEKALRAYNLALSDPENDTLLQESYDLLQEAFEEINAKQTVLSNQATTLDNQINENTEDLDLLSDMIGDIKNADLADVTIRLAELETQLEASYSIATKLLNLNLYDYIG